MERELQRRIENDVFDWLAMSAESFAILHTELARSGDYPNDLAVDDVVSVLHSMTENGWLEMSNPAAPSEKYWKKARRAYDEWLRSPPLEGELFQEYGPWWSITPDGEAELERRLEDQSNQSGA